MASKSGSFTLPTLVYCSPENSSKYSGKVPDLGKPTIFTSISLSTSNAPKSNTTTFLGASFKTVVPNLCVTSIAPSLYLLSTLFPLSKYAPPATTTAAAATIAKTFLFIIIPPKINFNIL